MGVCVQTQMYFPSYFNNGFNFVLNTSFTFIYVSKLLQEEHSLLKLNNLEHI